MEVSYVEMVLRLLAALGLGAVLGAQRELRGKAAGFKTLAMVSVGSASFTLLLLELMHDFAPRADNVRLDPARLVDGLVGGIGFLGAGAIIRSRGSVQGLTTAATVWVVGSLGLACGLGRIALAATVTLLALLILIAFELVERHLLHPNASDAEK